MVVSVTIFSSVGAARVDKLEFFSVEEALTYSMEDELLAKAEYEKIIEKYGVEYPEIPENYLRAFKKQLER